MNLIKNDKAWALLSQDEQLAISLKLGFTKSTWESGEIMSKAHYKFLEIEARAKFFLKMFTEHLQMYDDIIPDYLEMDERVKQYLIYTIRDRKKISDAVDMIDNDAFSIASVRHSIIEKDMVRLMRAKKLVKKNFASMVLDFDRWNNFRILPKSLQEPSAFKRRNKNADKSNIKNILSINTLTIDKIIERFGEDKKDKGMLYVPIFSKFVSPEHSILIIKNKNSTIAQLSKIGFYIFARKERADDFFNLLFTYDIETHKHCTEGQKFWPKYRQSIKHSINYNSIQKSIPSRKFLQSALKDMDLNLLYPKGTKPEFIDQAI